MMSSSSHAKEGALGKLLQRAAALMTLSLSRCVVAWLSGFWSRTKNVRNSRARFQNDHAAQTP
jgi:hypothetical protein